LTRRRVLRRRGQASVVGLDERQRSERLDGGIRLRRRGMLEGRSLRDGQLGDREYRRAGGPVEDVVLPVFAAVAERVGAEEERGLRAVVVPDVVVDLLEVPDRLAVLQLESDERGGEDVVADAVLAEDVRSGVAGDEIDQPQCRIDCGRIPDSSAASEVRVTRVAVRIGGREVPDDSPGARVEGEDLATDLEFAPRDA